MSLKINESAREKEKSLSDLFGDNLTEAGRADLGWAAKCAAQDLAMVIYSEDEPAQSNISEKTEDGLSGYTVPSCATFNSGYKLGYDNGYDGVYWTKECRHFINNGISEDLISPKYLQHHQGVEEGILPFYPGSIDENYFLREPEDRKKLKEIFSNFICKLENMGNRQSMLESQHHQLTKLNEITAIKTMTFKLQETGGPEYIMIIPQKLRADNKMILPRKKKAFHIGHKIK